MKITKYGHSCFLIEEGKARLLIDPGSFSSGFEDLTDLSAILITHHHADHVVPATLKKLVQANEGVLVVCDTDTAPTLHETGVGPRVVDDGDTLEIEGVVIDVIGREHAVIHPDIPSITNVGYMIAGRFFYPGDALTVPGREVEILALPAVAPWSKISETVDYLRAVKPQVAVPAHEQVTSVPGMYYDMIGGLAKPTDIRWQVMAPGETAEF